MYLDINKNKTYYKFNSRYYLFIHKQNEIILFSLTIFFYDYSYHNLYINFLNIMCHLFKLACIKENNMIIFETMK